MAKFSSSSQSPSTHAAIIQSSTSSQSNQVSIARQALVLVKGLLASQQLHAFLVKDCQSMAH